jgi:fructosamine-3-kinase
MQSKMIDTRLLCLIQEFFDGPVTEVTEFSGEQGNSGAHVHYFRAEVDGKVNRLVVKSATLLERRLVTLLQAQNQATPRSLCKTDRDGRDWLVMEYADDIPYATNESDEWSAPLGEALAKIHASNRGNRPEWLDPLPTHNPLHVVFADEWVDMYDQLLAENKEFGARYGKHEKGLRDSWIDFQQAIIKVLQSPQEQTLISTDLTPSHWRQIAGKPVLIDWEQSKFGPLYLDLPNLFNEKTVQHYYSALRKFGMEIPKGTFAKNFVSLSRYLGFRYMTVGFSFWLGTNVLGQDYWQSSGAVFFEKCLEIAQSGYPTPFLN